MFVPRDWDTRVDLVTPLPLGVGAWRGRSRRQRVGATFCVLGKLVQVGRSEVAGVTGARWRRDGGLWAKLNRD